MAEDKRRYSAGVKAADDAVFEEYAATKAAEFAALSAADKKIKQDSYAEDLVNFRIKQAKEAQLKWLTMTEKKMELKKKALNAAPFH